MAENGGILSIVPAVISKNVAFPTPVTLPYSVENPTIFWATYIYQIITIYTFVAIHVGTDITFFGLLLLVKRHQEMLKFRLQSLTKFSGLFDQNVNAEKEIKQIIIDHQRIYR